jgi:hypothetical protein
LKVAKEKHQATHKGKPIRITAYFSTETLKARRTWNEVFQELKETICKSRLLYPANLTIHNEREIFKTSMTNRN